MKSQILTVLSLALSVHVFSQTGRVGINTENPQQTFHIDGGKDNPTTGVPSAAQQVNDVVVSNVGQLGVGTSQPRAKLHITGGIATQIDTELRVNGSNTTDGDPGTAGQVLTSRGALNSPIWQTIPATATITADNGLTKTGNNVQLGGTLLRNTDIATAGFNTTFSGTGKVGIGTSSPSNLLTINKNGNATGIINSFVDGITITADVNSPGWSGPGLYLEGANATAGQKLFKLNYSRNTAGNSFLNFQAVADDAGSNTRPIMSVYHNGNVGIGGNPNGTPAAEKLDVVDGNVRVRTINTNVGNGTTDRLVVADANGVLKTIPKQNSVIYGGDFVDISPLVTVTAPSAPSSIVRSTIEKVAFTIDYESLVTFDYQLSYVVPNTTLISVADGRVRRVVSELRFTSVPAASSIPTNVLFAGHGVPFIVNSPSENVPGVFYLNGSQTLRLTPGNYEIDLVGGVQNNNLSGGPDFTVNFANTALDFLTITAKAIQ